MSPSELADRILSGSASIADVGNESDWTEALAELETRCAARGIPVPDRSDDRFNPEALVAALTGQAASTSTPAPDAVSAAIVTRLRSERDKAQADLERERTEHASTKAELATLRASVESDGELKTARAEVVKLQGVIETMKRDHEAALKVTKDSVHQEAAGLIVKYGIREPRAEEHQAYVSKTETVTQQCERAARAAGIKAN